MDFKVCIDFNVNLNVRHHDGDNAVLNHIHEMLHAQSCVLAGIANSVSGGSQELKDAAAALKAKSDALAVQLAAAPKL